MLSGPNNPMVGWESTPSQDNLDTSVLALSIGRNGVTSRRQDVELPSIFEVSASSSQVCVCTFPPKKQYENIHLPVNLLDCVLIYTQSLCITVYLVMYTVTKIMEVNPTHIHISTKTYTNTRKSIFTASGKVSYPLSSQVRPFNWRRQVWGEGGGVRKEKI